MRKALVAGVILAAVATGVSLAAYVAAQTAQNSEAEKMLIANERAINEAILKGNLAGFKQHVASDGWAIDPMMGRMATAEFLQTFDQVAKDLKITSWEITDTKTIWADPNTAVLTYKWTGMGTYQGQPIPSPVWASTVWTKRGGKWTAIFHQESSSMEAAQKK
jgi:ketosteroid isomerase-like protein